MSFSKTLLLALAASAALASCSSEPSDWRPDDKVSLDQVEPGTRNTANIGQDNDHGHHGPGVEHEDISNNNLDIRAAPTAAEARSANSVPAGQEAPHSTSVIADTAASGHQIQR